jgi:hypothetical protein
MPACERIVSARAGNPEARLIRDEGSESFQFHDGAVAPVFLAGKFLYGAAQRSVRFGREDARLRRKCLVPHSYLHLRVGLHVSQPLRRWAFGDDVEAALALGEPDLDRARKAARSAASGEVQVLFGSDVTIL